MLKEFREDDLTGEQSRCVTVRGQFRTTVTRYNLPKCGMVTMYVSVESITKGYRAMDDLFPEPSYVGRLNMSDIGPGLLGVDDSANRQTQVPVGIVCLAPAHDEHNPSAASSDLLLHELLDSVIVSIQPVGRECDKDIETIMPQSFLESHATGRRRRRPLLPSSTKIRSSAVAYPFRSARSLHSRTWSFTESWKRVEYRA